MEEKSVKKEGRQKMENGITNYIGQMNYAEKGGVVNVFNPNEELPPIRDGIMASCNPYIEGRKRSEDIANIKDLLKKSGQVIWLYGEGGIGKTELICRFAEVHPEYEYIFVTFKGSIDQTISQNLFYLPGYEMKGMELTDIARYQQNMSTLSLYHSRLIRENRNLILIIDNYNPANYEKTFREMTEIIIDNEFSGEKNDLNTIQDILRTGINVILTTRMIPDQSDAYLTYEVKEMDESDLFEVMIGHFTRISPFLDAPGIRVKLIKLIRIAEYNTVFITIFALAMQTSELSPIEAIDTMLNSMDSDHEYHLRYAEKSAKLHDHMEKVLRFIGLNYQDKQVLGTLTMLPSVGINDSLYHILISTGAVQLDQKREKILQRLMNNHIVIQRQKVCSDNTSFERILYMHPLVSQHAQQIIYNNELLFFINLIEQTWIGKILSFFDKERIEKIAIKDKDYKYLIQIADLCSNTELRLKALQESVGKQYEDKIVNLRRSLLLKAAEISDKQGNAKDAIEYIERTINIEGPSWEDVDIFINTANYVGVLYYKGGYYSKAKHFFYIALKLLNDRNGIIFDNIEDVDTYVIEDIIESEDALFYAPIFNNIAGIFTKQSKHSVALKYYERTLAINEQLQGKDHEDTATIYNNIGAEYSSEGKRLEALQFYMKALSIRETKLGENHPTTAVTYGNIASIYDELDEKDEALKYYEKALAIRKNMLGENHPSTAKMYWGIAGVYGAKGKYEEAINYYGKALAIIAKTLGEKHLTMAELYCDMAIVYRSQKKYTEELDCYQKAVAIRKQMPGNYRPSLQAIYESIALVYTNLGKNEKALKYFEMALAISEKIHGENHQDTLDLYKSISVVLYEMNDYQKAEEYARKAIVLSNQNST